MIKDLAFYRKMDDEERWDALRRMSPEESIALGEALLTSEIMEIVEPGCEDRPVCLAVALGIRRRYAESPPQTG